MDENRITINSYNQNALGFAQKFNDLGARKNDIETVFSLIKEKEPRVLELGCGNGRDAAEILRHTDDYIGIDAAEGLVTIARNQNPSASFQVADFVKYDFPKNIDVIFAFATLIHLNKDDLKSVFKKAAKSLRRGGVFFMSMKAGKYSRYVSEDELGERIYFFYELKDLCELAGEDFELVEKDQKNFLHDDWLNLIFKRVK
jgi:SAM-dependent methyltransferase